MYKLVAICVFAIIVKDVTVAATKRSLNDEQESQVASLFYNYGVDCHSEYPITDKEAQEFMNVRFPSGDRTGCFAACVLKKAGIFDKQGKLSETSAMEGVKQIVKDEQQQETVAQMLRACSKVNDEPSDSEGCQRSVSAYYCLMEQAKGYGVEY